MLILMVKVLLVIVVVNFLVEVGYLLGCMAQIKTIFKTSLDNDCKLEYLNYLKHKKFRKSNIIGKIENLILIGYLFK